MEKTVICFIGFTIIALLFFRCSKDKSDTPWQITALTAKSYKVSSVTRPRKTDTSLDSVISTSCTTDDSITFYTSRSFWFNDAKTKCDSATLPYSKGVWDYDFTNDSIRLAITNPAKRYISWKVLTLDDTWLKVNFTDSSIDGDSYTKTILFKRY